MWIENNDLELMNSIFETEELIPRNRKGGLKLRHIFYNYKGDYKCKYKFRKVCHARNYATPIYRSVEKNGASK